MLFLLGILPSEHRPQNSHDCMAVLGLALESNPTTPSNTARWLLVESWHSAFGRLVHCDLQVELRTRQSTQVCLLRLSFRSGYHADRSTHRKTIAGERQLERLAEMCQTHLNIEQIIKIYQGHNND